MVPQELGCFVLMGFLKQLFVLKFPSILLKALKKPTNHTVKRKQSIFDQTKYFYLPHTYIFPDFLVYQKPC